MGETLIIYWILLSYRNIVGHLIWLKCEDKETFLN